MDRTTEEHLTAREAEAIRLYAEERLTLKEVGARLGVSRSTVHGILKAAGVSRRSPNWRPGWLWPHAEARSREITHAYVQEGLSLQEVGARFGLSRGTVSEILRRAGLGGSLRRRITGGPPHLKGRNDEIARLYAEGGLTLREIGERFNLSSERVRQIGRRAGARPRVARVPFEHLSKRNREIIRLYVKEGLTSKEIGARFDLGHAYVCQIARRARDQEVARLYAEEGLTAKEAGTRFGLGPRVVSDVLRRVGVSLTRSITGTPPHLKRRNDEIVRLYVEAKLPLRDVAARVGLSHERVRQILRRRAVMLRRRGAEKAPQRASQEARQKAPQKAPQEASQVLPRRPGRPCGWRDGALAERNEHIIHAYDQEKLSLAQVGALFGLNPTTVSDILRQAGVSRRKPGLSRLDATERTEGTARGHHPTKSPVDHATEPSSQIAHLYVEEGLSLREVATRVALSPGAVHQALKRAGVARRSPSGPRPSVMKRNREIARLYREEGLTPKGIGVRMELSATRVRQVLKRLGAAGAQPGSGKPLP